MRARERGSAVGVRGAALRSVALPSSTPSSPLTSCSSSGSKTRVARPRSASGGSSAFRAAPRREASDGGGSAAAGAAEEEEEEEEEEEDDEDEDEEDEGGAGESGHRPMWQIWCARRKKGQRGGFCG